MRPASRRGLRATMIATAVVAVLLTGVRAMPPLQSWGEGYLLWQGRRQHHTDVEVARASWGTESAPYRRALINRQVSEMQFASFISEAFPDPISSACFGALCLSAVAVAFAFPAWCLRVIRRRIVCDSATRSCGNSDR
jgi:hypothetical protein